MLRPGGFLIVKAFSPKEPGTWGPHRIAHEELEETLGGRLDLVHLEEGRFHGSMDHAPHAWFAVFQQAVRPDV